MDYSYEEKMLNSNNSHSIILIYKLLFLITYVKLYSTNKKKSMYDVPEENGKYGELILKY